MGKTLRNRENKMIVSLSPKEFLFLLGEWFPRRKELSVLFCDLSQVFKIVLGTSYVLNK